MLIRRRPERNDAPYNENVITLGTMYEFQSLRELPRFTRDDNRRNRIERSLEPRWKMLKLFLWQLLPSAVLLKK